jgi:hypothetical protein
MTKVQLIVLKKFVMIVVNMDCGWKKNKMISSFDKLLYCYLQSPYNLFGD